MFLSYNIWTFFNVRYLFVAKCKECNLCNTAFFMGGGGVGGLWAGQKKKLHYHILSSQAANKTNYPSASLSTDISHGI